ncbi:hypothetical protein CLOSYM_01692 [[Clostridium] symbiosum ATCC 14940]|uniref:Uncharacterized protein n=1 Tax=[Clostridium] symbiosum ATCC 14940 TaxID=411472 RepID=A0ABC9TZA3_CLOSY|nr:hypothetical protein CLOSYM_01692 [[Clostridium] symbiosum ATCC 14940]
MFLTEHGVSDGNQRRFSAVNAETVYAQYNGVFCRFCASRSVLLFTARRFWAGCEQ